MDSLPKADPKAVVGLKTAFPLGTLDKEKLMNDPHVPEDDYYEKALPAGVEATIFVDDTLLTQEDIQNRFGFHKAAIEGPNVTAEVHRDLRVAFMQFSDYLNNRLGSGRYAALAQTALEEASMWSHKAIAQNNPTESEN